MARRLLHQGRVVRQNRQTLSRIMSNNNPRSVFRYYPDLDNPGFANVELPEEMWHDIMFKAIMATQPYDAYNLIRNLMERGLGTYGGQFLSKWIWFDDKLKTLSNQELVELYFLLKRYSS